MVARYTRRLHARHSAAVQIADSSTARSTDDAALMEVMAEQRLLDAVTLALHPRPRDHSLEANITRDWCLLDVVRRPKHVAWVSAEHGSDY